MSHEDGRRNWQDRQWFFGESAVMKAGLAVGARWGSGNVMDVIANAWAATDPRGARTVGPCRGRRPRRPRRAQKPRGGA